MNQNNKLPLVSVVIATYNGEKFLGEQLNSIFNQSYPNIEIICVDDGSSDKTIEILDAYTSAHQNMKVYTNEKNLGYIKNFEKGCRLANGELIALCDQDDFWHPDKIKLMEAAMGNYPMIYCDSYVCDEALQKKNKRISDIVNYDKIENCIQLAAFCRIYGHATLFTRSLFNAADPLLECIPHDWWLSYTATLHGGANYLNEPLVFYRQHASNVFGAVGGKSKKYLRESRKERKRKEISNIRLRLNYFYEACPSDMEKEKKILHSLLKSYQSFSLKNNFLRMLIFFRNMNALLFVKKYSAFRRWLFCVKMFAKIK